MSYIVEIFWSDATDTQKQALRHNLRQTLTELGVLPHWREFNYHPRRPNSGRASRILINGREVFRLSSSQEMVSIDELKCAVNMGRRRRKTRLFRASLQTSFPAVLMAFFPKCPVCWATYMSLFIYCGLTFPYRSWFMWIFVALAVLNLFLAFDKGRKTGFYLPLVIQLIAYSLILTNRFYWNLPALAYANIALLMSSFIIMNLRKVFFHQLKLKFYGA